MRYEELIEVKRDGRRHTAEEIDRIVLGYTAGDVPDYQMAAWLMAAYLNGLTADETVWLTDAMVRSGRIVDLSTVDGTTVDKHSTGGVADTTTLVVAPLAAACGVPVAKMSGRGLGHTGGTLDKLESIPGMRTEMDADDFVEQVRRVGVAVIAQSPDIDPADKMIYALRDVTATVPSIPLIVGSIISKKVAGGADAILLDVKVGSGAFMKTAEQARGLASELVRVGRALGREVHCVMSDMDQPLGMAVGNALEVAEAIRTLQAAGPPELTEVCVSLAAKMLVLGGVVDDESRALRVTRASLSSGAALEKFERWIEAQGGDARVARDVSRLPRATLTREVLAERDGFLGRIDAEETGRVAMLLGAGRASKDDIIDPGAGLVLDVRVGHPVRAGDRLATLHSERAGAFDEAERRLKAAFTYSVEPVSPPPLFHEV
ncbi:MAG TPA: thymidine phosphorylase [Coriobacteriia bacterium]|nr:thymidine phosphorylase [Coriobacteriia bacterium]